MPPGSATSAPQPIPRAARAKTMMGMGPADKGLPAQQAARPQPPPPPTRRPPPPPSLRHDDDDDRDHEQDEAPTAMFVHPVPMQYDPDGPPSQPFAGSSPSGASMVGVPDDDDELSEPATAIHIPAYRPDEYSGRGADSGKRKVSAPLPAAGTPAAPPTSPPQPSFPSTRPAPHAPAPDFSPRVDKPFIPAEAAAPQRPAPQTPPAPQMHPAPQMPPAPPPAMQMPPAPPAAMQFPAQPQSAPQAMPAAAFATALVARPPPPVQTPLADSDAAPLWLKFAAACSVLSAFTVLGVLGWMVVQRF